jgi:hypothetical protein
MSRRFQFSLRALLVATLGFSVAALIIARELARLRHSNVFDLIPFTVAWLIAGASIGLLVAKQPLMGVLSGVFWAFASLLFLFAFAYVIMVASW